MQASEVRMQSKISARRRYQPDSGLDLTVKGFQKRKTFVNPPVFSDKLEHAEVRFKSSSLTIKEPAISMTIDFGLTANDYARHRAGFPESFFERIAKYNVGRHGQVHR